jgi:hypothetical protein
MYPIQRISFYTAPALMIGGSAYVVAALAQRVLEAAFTHRVVSPLANIVVTVIVLGKAMEFAIAVALNPYLVCVGFLVAYFVEQGISTALRGAPPPPALAPAPAFVVHQPLSLRESVTEFLGTKKILFFIRYAIRAGKVNWVLELNKFLFGLEEFGDRSRRSGLTTWLQEEILKDALEWDKPELLEHFFIRPAEVGAAIDIAASLRLIPVLAQIVADHVECVVDAQGRFKAYAILDGSLINDLKNSQDERFKAFGLREQDRAQSDDLDETDEKMSENLANTPLFGGVDFGPLLARLQFEAQDDLPLA